MKQIMCIRLIDEERESNAIAASGKGLTGHRKRSIHQFPSSDIVGIYPTYEQVPCCSFGEFELRKLLLHCIC